MAVHYTACPIHVPSCARSTCDWLANQLTDAGLDVACYHAGKDADRRARVLRDWAAGATPVVVATVAFGMGIDKADVRCVGEALCRRSLIFV